MHCLRPWSNLRLLQYDIIHLSIVYHTVKTCIGGYRLAILNRNLTTRKQGQTKSNHIVMLYYQLKQIT